MEKEEARIRGSALHSGNLTYNEEDPLFAFKCRKQPLPLGLPKVARSTPKSLKMP
jgi:hypothetical protein